MTDKLKEFVNKNKKEFDIEEPSKDLWNKINAKLETNNSSRISSKWVSKFKYFGLGASVLVIATYIITQKFTNYSSSELTQNVKDSAINNSGEWAKINRNRSTVNEQAVNTSNSDDKKTLVQTKTSHIQPETSANLNKVGMQSEDSASQAVKSEISLHTSSTNEVEKPSANSISDKKENVPAIKVKKVKVNVPAEPEKINTYNGILYEGYSLCSVLRAYKFPGQVSMDEDGNYTNRRILKTISCNRLENISNPKAVWVKGKTSKKLTIAIEEGFKNIRLIKSDGREITPVAISHYYPGLGVITDYTGKHFDMMFKDKVEIILFFKDVEDGDKISVDGVIESVVKTAQ